MSESAIPVTLYGTPLGSLERRDGRLDLRWDREAEDRWGLNSPVLSASLRVGVRSPAATESFFGGLLPEGNGLVQLARRLQVRSDDLFGIFSLIGADLAGALTIGGDRDDTDEVLELRDEALADALAEAHGFVVDGGGSAVPGLQRKLALTRVGERWAIGKRRVPSTHILKPVGSEQLEAILREQFTLELGRRLGLVTFDSWIDIVGDEHVLVVERYDRAADADRTVRIHQEDFAQALGLPWGGNAKFQWDDGRANLAAMAALLDRDRSIFATGESQRERLLRYVTFNVAVGNTDAHAKNFSILRPDGERPRLAPLYDASPIMLGYEAGHGLALYVDDERQLPRVTTGHLVREAGRWGIPEQRARGIVVEMLEGLRAAVDETLVADRIAETAPGFIRGLVVNLLDGRQAGHGLRGPLGPKRRIDSSTFGR